MHKSIYVLFLLLALFSYHVHVNALVPLKPTATIPYQAGDVRVLPTGAPDIEGRKLVKRNNVQETLSMIQDWANDCNRDSGIVDKDVNADIRQLWHTTTIYCGNNKVKTVTRTKTVHSSPTGSPSSPDDDKYTCDAQCWSDYLWHTYGYGITVAQGFTGITCILIGLYFMIFGFRFFRPTLGFVGFVFFAYMTWIGLVNNEPALGYPHTEIVYICVSIGLGLLGGVLFLFFYPIGLYFVGVLGGFLFAVYLMSWKANLVIQIKVARICFIIGMGVLFVIFIVLLESYTILFCTSFIGAYLFILGLDFFAHTGFINATLLIFDGNPYHYNVYITNQPVIVMMAFVIILTLVSGAGQYYFNIYRDKRLFGINVVEEKAAA
ncbi:hypothetical protein BX666DRAFT_2130887 [Dichotomocladium elegans]|nr:hypothetical protein BX666DRAFT_2130887 [Dichotomocladium elegans]